LDTIIYRVYNITPVNHALVEEPMDPNYHSFFQYFSSLFSILGREPAYLDPGSGSYFIQLVLASLMGGLFLLGVYRRKVTDYFRNLFSRNKPEEEQEDQDE